MQPGVLTFLCSAIYSVHSAGIGAQAGTQRRRPVWPERSQAMIKNFDEMNRFGKDNMDASMKSFGAVSKSFQAIAVEAADYAKKAFEEATAVGEKLAAAKSPDKVMEVQ